MTAPLTTAIDRINVSEASIPDLWGHLKILTRRIDHYERAQDYAATGSPAYRAASANVDECRAMTSAIADELEDRFICWSGGINAREFAERILHA